MTKLEIIISVGGRFHIFKLAEQLERFGLLRYIITSLPRFALKNETIDKKKIKTFPLAEIINYGMSLCGKYENGEYLKAVVFDKYVSVGIKKSDVFIGSAGFCLLTMKNVKQNNTFIIVDRACPHIAEQVSSLKMESRNLGMKFTIDKRIIDKMTKEYELADIILVPSEYSRKSFLRQGVNENKIRIAALSGKFPAPAFMPIREKQDIFRVLFLGGNIIRKGLIYLLHAWNELNLKNAELVIRTSHILNKTSIKGLLLKPTIKIVGYQRDLSWLYSQASIFCLPSIDDGFGMAVLEAMSYGLPAIITENVGAADCIRNGIDGFIIKIRDVESIKEKITYLYENDYERMQMGINARRKALEFTWDRYGDAVVRIISECRRECLE